MPAVFGGEKAWKTRRLGDIGIAYHWVNDEPAMVLFPATRRMASAGAFIVCLSAAHQYVHSDGHPNLDYMMHQAMQAAVTMGFMRTDKSVIKTIIDAITDGMPDLVSMPPEPRSHVEEAAKSIPNIGEMSLSIDGQVVAERDVADLTENEVRGTIH